MESALALIAIVVTLAGNLMAVSIAGFGVYRGAVRELEQERTERQRLQHLLDECEDKVERLQVQLRTAGRGGMTFNDSNVRIGRDAVAGDETIGRDATSVGRDLTRTDPSSGDE